MSSSSSPIKKFKFTRLLNWFLFVALVLGLIIGIFQGPVTRSLVEKYLVSTLEASGFEGSFRVDGSLFSGIAIHDIQLKNNNGIRELSAKKLSVHYKLSEIIKGKVNLIDCDGLHLWYDISQQNKEHTSQVSKENSNEEPFDIEKIRQNILPIKILFNNASVWISQDEKFLWKAENLSLTHHVGSESFRILTENFYDAESNPLKDQETVITWEKQQFSIKNIPLHSEIFITDSALSYNNKDIQHFQANVKCLDGAFYIEYDDSHAMRTKLLEGEIELSKLTPWLGKEIDISGSLTEFSFRANDILATPLESNIDFNITGKNLLWDQKKLDQLSIQSSLKNGIANLESVITFDKASENKPAKIHAHADFKKSESTTWLNFWRNTKANIDLQLPNIPDDSTLSQWLDTPPPLGGFPKGHVTLSAKTTISDAHWKDPEFEITAFNWKDISWANTHWENLALTALWNPKDKSVNAKVTATDQESKISLKGSYFLETNAYSGKLSINNLKASHFNPALQLHNLSAPRAGKINLTWNGSGVLNDLNSNQGNILADLEQLDLPSENKTQPWDINLQGSYHKGFAIDLKNIEVQRGNLKFITSGSWDKKTLSLDSLELYNQGSMLTKGHAIFPLSTDVSNLDEFLQQKEPIDINLMSKGLSLSEIYEQLLEPAPHSLSGKLDSKIAIKGTLLEPDIQITSDLKRLTIKEQEYIPTSNISFQLTTENQILKLDGTIKPGTYQDISIKGNFPLHLQQWRKTPESILDEHFSLALKTHKINLSPFVKKIPSISDLNGDLAANLQISGSINQPAITGKSQINIKRIITVNDSIPNLRDINVQLSIKDNQLSIAPSSCLFAGGKHTIQGDVNFEDIANPIFDISLDSEKALLWRNDALIVRADGKINLTGAYQNANISGDIDIVQSLYYKDIHIIPIGTTGGSSESTSAALPQFKKKGKKNNSGFGLPKPFANWTLDLTAKTKDDILIRGNIAKGNISGSVKIQGTLDRPEPTGQVELEKAEATLPFSKLRVKKGKAIFSPKHGFDPQLSIKGTSKVGSHDVNISLYGLASNPQTLLISNPPLPENEIVFLLATGSTSENLTNTAAATGKAYQLLVDSILRSSSTSKLKALTQALTEISQRVEINIGGADPFTGRKYNSARLELHDRWFLLGSIDSENHTRGLIVYALRFH